MSILLSHQRELKEKLPHTWNAFLARFGRFTEIQALAVEPLLAGKNCMLVSPTASGKTEAALMPLIERIKHNQTQESRNSLRLVYVVPTRALTRDLARRLVYYRTTWDAIRDRPLLGTGYGTYADAFRAYNHAGTGTYFLDKAHSTYLQMIMELGWPAAAARSGPGWPPAAPAAGRAAG